MENNDLTENNKRRQPRRILTKSQMKAIVLRYNDKTHREIALELGKNPGVIRGWFMSGGTIYNEYQDYANKENAKRMNEVQSRMRQNITTAMDRLLQIIKSPDNKESLPAVKELFDRTLGKAVQPIITGDAGQQVIEKWKKELGIDEQSIIADSFGEMDMDDSAEEALSIPEENRPADNQSDSV